MNVDEMDTDEKRLFIDKMDIAEMFNDEIAVSVRWISTKKLHRWMDFIDKMDIDEKATLMKVFYRRKGCHQNYYID